MLSNKSGPSYSSRSLIIRFILFVLVSLILTIFILMLYNFKYTINTILFIILVPLMIAPFFFSSDIFHPFNIFFIKSQFLFVFNMIDVNAHNNAFRYGNLPTSYFENAFFWSIFIIIIWYIFMFLGYTFSKSTLTKPIQIKLFRINHLYEVSIFLIMIGTLSYIYIVYLKGGFIAVFDAMRNRVEAYEGLHYLLKLVALNTIAAILLLKLGYKKASFIIITLSFLMQASFGGRSNAFFGTIIPYLIFYHYNVKRLNIIKLLPLGVLAALFAISIGNYRIYGTFRVEAGSLYALFSSLAYGSSGGEILPSLVGSLLKGHIDYLYGSNLINIIYAPIPRSIWPEKPIIEDSGIVGKALMGDNYWGLPPGPYGLAFFNFGFFGVIIAAFFVGFIIYKLYYKFVLNHSKKYVGQIFYLLTVTSFFSFFSTRSQIDILWYIGMFVIIKLFDNLLFAIRRKNQY